LNFGFWILEFGFWDLRGREKRLLKGLKDIKLEKKNRRHPRGAKVNTSNYQ
jgi:hypothetical protein